MGVVLYKEGASRASLWARRQTPAPRPRAPAPRPAGPGSSGPGPDSVAHAPDWFSRSPRTGPRVFPIAQVRKLGLGAAKRLLKGKEQAGDRASAQTPGASPTGLPVALSLPVSTDPAGRGNAPHRAGRNCRLVPAALSATVSAARGVPGARPPTITPSPPGPGHRTSKGRRPRAARHTLGATGTCCVTGWTAAPRGGAAGVSGHPRPTRASVPLRNRAWAGKGPARPSSSGRRAGHRGKGPCPLPGFRTQDRPVGGALGVQQLPRHLNGAETGP